jgi:hypothetical protein
MEASKNGPIVRGLAGGVNTIRQRKAFLRNMQVGSAGERACASATSGRAPTRAPSTS